VREITGRRQNGDFEIALDLAEPAELLDGRHRSLLAPNQQSRLAQTAQGVTNIYVQMTRQKCCGCMARTTLM
jgi:hypothetical protein